MYKSKNICSKEEYIAGHKTELEMKPLIENLLKVKLIAKRRYSKFDFEDKLKKILVEVKGNSNSNCTGDSKTNSTNITCYEQYQY